MSTHLSSTLFYRFCFALIPLAIYCLYHPISLYTNALDGHSPSFWLDEITPFSSSWIFVYALIYFVVFLPVFVLSQKNLFHRCVYAFIFLEVVSYLFFILYPVHILSRPLSLEIQSFSDWGTRLCYYWDKPTNCCPSLHVGMSMLAAFCCFKSDKLVGGIAFFIALLISISTMTLKQHYFIDVVLGAFFASLAYRFFVATIPLEKEEEKNIIKGRRQALTLVVAYLVTILVFYALYRSEWQPWIS